jgi:hypothetical protein
VPIFPYEPGTPGSFSRSGRQFVDEVKAYIDVQVAATSPASQVSYAGSPYLPSNPATVEDALDALAAKTIIDFQTVAYASSITPNPTLGEDIKVGVLTGNITINNVAAPVTGQRMRLILTQDATGGRTVAWGTAYDIVTTIAAGAGVRTSWPLVYDGTKWLEVR